MKKKILFIINPVSGTRQRAKKILPGLIKRYLDHDQYSYEIRFTQSPGHARDIATEAARQKIDIVAVAGGDGSVNEVAEALVHTGTILGILPLGSGNGLARHLRYPMRPSKMLGVFNRGVTQKIDVIRYGDGKIYCSTAGFGFDAFVTVLFEEMPFRGFFSYSFNILKAAYGYDTFNYQLIAKNEKLEGEAFLITAFNSNQYGYNVRVIPDASLQDGKMDLFVVKKYPRWKFLWLAFRVLTGKHLSNKYFEHIVTSEALIKTEKPVHFQVDGEMGKLESELLLKVVPDALNVLIP